MGTVQTFWRAKQLGFGDELYDVESDPLETTNLSNIAEYKAVETELNSLLIEFFRKYFRAEADLWNVGTAIQNSVRGFFWRDAWGEQ